MSLSVGDKLPDAVMTRLGNNGPETVNLSDKLNGRKVAIFAVPGAYTPTCHSAHVPSFIRTKDAFDAKGVDEIICIIGKPVPARAAAPSGLSFIRLRASAKRERSRFSIST